MTSATTSATTPATTSSAPFAPSRSPRPDDGIPLDTGVAFALRRRSFLVGGLGLSAAGALVACGSSGGNLTDRKSVV